MRHDFQQFDSMMKNNMRVATAGAVLSFSVIIAMCAGAGWLIYYVVTSPAAQKLLGY
jgi:hypothetical protein